MQQRRLFGSLTSLALMLALSACAPSVSLSDLSKPTFGVNPDPSIMLDPPYVMGDHQKLLNPSSSCLLSNYRCTPQGQQLEADGVLR
jgi:hypothetical protein